MFFEYEYLIEDIEDFMKKQEEQEKANKEKYNLPNFNKMKNNFSVPKINIPNKF